MKLKVAVFDLDGTLLDSLGIWMKIDRTFLGKRGFEVPDDYQKIIASMTYRETAEYTIARFGLSDTPDDLISEWNSLAIEEYKTSVTLRPYARRFLDYIDDKGMKIVAATTLDEKMIYPCLSRLALFPYFEEIFTSKSLGVGKHNPAFFEKLCDRLDIRPQEAIVFDDVASVIAAAKSIGMTTCAVLGGSSDESEFTPAPDYMIKDFEEAPFFN